MAHGARLAVWDKMTINSPFVRLSLVNQLILKYVIKSGEHRFDFSRNGHQTMHHITFINSLMPSDAYVSVNLANVVPDNGFSLFGTKSLSKPILPYCQSDPKEHMLMKNYPKFERAHSRKRTWKCRLQNGSNCIFQCINCRRIIQHYGEQKSLPFAMVSSPNMVGAFACAGALHCKG